MADTYSVAIQALINLAGSNLELVPTTVVGTPVFRSHSPLLVTGDNLFTPPAATSWMLFIPDSRNTDPYVLKSNYGTPAPGTDGGIVISQSKPLIIPLSDAAVINIIAAGNDTYVSQLYFF